MRSLSQRTVFAILMAAMFIFCIILALETSLSFGWMVGGYVVVFGAAFTFMYVRFAPVVMIGTIALLLSAYLIYKIGGTAEERKGRGLSASIGAIAAIASVLMLQMGWVKPHQESVPKHSDYVQEQKKLYEQEKGGGDYASQQRAQYEQEKARQAQPPEGSGQSKPPG